MLPAFPRRPCLFSLAAIFVAGVSMAHAFQACPRLVGSTSQTSWRRSNYNEDRANEQYPAERMMSPRLSMSLPVESGPTSRGRAIAVGLSGWMGLMTAMPAPGSALNPVKKMQEQMRIRAQEEFDNVEALASPEGGKTIQPVLTLVPIITLRLLLDEVEGDLKDPRRFGDALAILQAQDFQKKDIKRVFNAYSDNIYYLPDSDRENKYLQGGASPTSRQTIQYLLRNDVIDNVEALTAEVAYLIREREEADSSEDGSAPDTDEKDLRMYLSKCKEGFDKYLGMVFQYEIDEATEMAKVALATKKGAAGPAASKK